MIVDLPFHPDGGAQDGGEQQSPDEIEFGSRVEPHATESNRAAIAPRRANDRTFDASPTGNSATVARYDFDESWCFDYGAWYDCRDQTFSVTHTRAVGPLGTCVSTHLFKIVDFEVQMDKYTGPGC
jgi:hypothetical protein